MKSQGGVAIINEWQVEKALIKRRRNALNTAEDSHEFKRKKQFAKSTKMLDWYLWGRIYKAIATARAKISLNRLHSKNII